MDFGEALTELNLGGRVSRNRMNFGEAIKELKMGGRVSRNGWNGKNMHLELQIPDDYSKMTLPYIYMYTAQGELVPWLASQTDVLAEDWEVLKIGKYFSII